LKLDSYEQLKVMYSNAENVNATYIEGTVYTPEKNRKQMLYLLLKNDLVINQPLFLDSFQTTWSSFYGIERFESSILKEESNQLLKYFLSRSILDPCCGTGLLLLTFIEWLLFLCTTPLEYKMVKVYCYTSLYAWDLDLSALDVFKSLIKLLFKNHHMYLKVDDLNIFCGDSLLSTLATVDLIIANPPYIGEKGHKALFDKMKMSDLGRAYYEGKMDYYYFFIYKAAQILSENGSSCFLTSNYFFTANGASKLRSVFKNKCYISQIIKYRESALFKGYHLHACIYTFQKSPLKEVAVYDSDLNVQVKINYSDIFSSSGTMHFIDNTVSQEIIKKMDLNCVGNLGNYASIRQGIVSGADRLKTGERNEPVFVYKKNEVHLIPKPLRAYLKPFYKNSQIEHYRTKGSPNYFILYLSDIPVASKNIELIEKWLEPYKSILSRRREVEKGTRLWYELTWPRDESIFKGNKIVVPQRAYSNCFAYETKPFYASADVYFITAFSLYDMKILNLYLNSDIIYFWLYLLGKKKGKLFELYATPLKNIPIPKLDKYSFDKLQIIANENNKIDEKRNALIDEIFYDAFRLKDDQKKYLQEKMYEDCFKER